MKNINDKYQAVNFGVDEEEPPDTPAIDPALFEGMDAIYEFETDDDAIFQTPRPDQELNPFPFGNYHQDFTESGFHSDICESNGCFYELF